MSRIKYVLTLSLSCALFLGGCSKGSDSEPLPAEVITAGEGKFTFSSYEPFKDRPLTVYYSVSKGDRTHMPILFVFPGTNRDADNYILPWVDVTASHACMVFSVEFPEKYYSDNEYITGNVMDDSGRLVDRAHWTFSMIDPLFEMIKAETGNTTTTYQIFGHSAGAQFAHRYALFCPEAPVERVISANAGWYTMPDLTVAFPYGLKNTQRTPADVEAAFRVRLTVQLGEKDTNPNDPSLRKTAEAMRQGAYRYARGEYFYNNSKIQSSAYRTDFAWSERIVPNVGHDQAAMAKDAAKIFFAP